MPRPVEPEDLTAYAFLSTPSLSPDGKTVALSVHRALLDKDEYEGNLWLVPVAGGAPRHRQARPGSGCAGLCRDHFLGFCGPTLATLATTASMPGRRRSMARS